MPAGKTAEVIWNCRGTAPGNNAGINDTPHPPRVDLTIQNVHTPTLGTKIDRQISTVFGLAGRPGFSFMLHSERLRVFSRTNAVNYVQRANAHAQAMTSNAPPPGCYRRSNLPATPRYGTYWGAWGLFLIPT